MMTRSYCTRLLLAAVALVGLSARAGADDLTYFLRDPSGINPRGLYNFNTTTTASTLQTAVTSGNMLFAFDVRPSDGVVFGVDLGGNLFTISTSTGAVTVIGSSGVGQLTAIAVR